MKFCPIILAAGQSSRMGKIKALLPLPRDDVERSALEGLARLYRAAGFEDILVISGCHAEQVEAAAKALSLTVARNPRPDDGMFSSVCVGLRAAPPDSDAFFIHPVDVPLVRTATAHLLARTHAARIARAESPVVVIPLCDGREGHPLLVPDVFKRAILSHSGENGLRGALASLPEQDVLALETGDPGVTEDMDSPDDYARLRALALNHRLP
ncbi:MAG: nucleotidyltransferase family protein [Desulfovibrio sp.]|jgi:CTP:molybdopterin cytidylyltransferase MocA|nr:nucleotidyltransferase family protein [Desulfovibrio sp.]